MKYPICTLSSILNPGMYCVVSTNKEHVSEVFELEENMTKEMLHDTTSEFELCSQMWVAVTNTEEKFRRGVIEKKLDNDLYQILLMDYGNVINVGKSNIKVITNEDFTTVEPLSFIVQLYGLVPTKYVSVGTVRKPRACKEWNPESKVFVENLFKDNHKVIVQSILIQHRTVYGDLFVQPKPNMKFISLRKLLCEYEFCVFSESRFIRQENLDVYTDSMELEMKMGWVEKWQRENFGTPFQKRLFELPVAVCPSKSHVTDITSLNLSAPESVCEVLEQTREVPYKRVEMSETSQAKSEGLGLGRGKIKMLLAEMKKKEAALSTEPGSSFQMESTEKVETKVSLGRGHFLNKYLEIKKSQKADTETAGDSPTQPQLTRESSERFSDAEKPEIAEKMNVSKMSTKMEKAVVRAGEFSELSDSNELTEVSLSTEDEMPPLVRNLTVDKKFTDTVVSGDKCDRQNELDKPNCDRKTNSTVSRKSKFGGSDLRWNEVNPRDLPKTSDVSAYGGTKSVWEQSTTQHMLNGSWAPYVRFPDSVVEPVKTFGELPIQPDIIKNLEKGGRFGCLSQVQRWSIPAIRKLLNTVVIGSPKTGKTLSYVVPLMDYVQDESYFEELPQGNGPSVVIVASSSRVCESIYYLCYSLLGCYTQREMLRSKVKIVLALGGCEKDVWVALTNGCSVLISTPHCLVRLLETPILTNLERLTCLVLDEVDVISQHPFRKNVGIILEKAEFSTRSRFYQKIFCGEKWTRNVENLVKSYAESYALVVGSPSEAAVYEGLKPSIFLVEHSKKAEVVLDKLKDVLGKWKILIVCEETSDAVSLKDFLNRRKIPAILAHEKMLADKLKDVAALWKSERDSVLVSTDGVLNELKIRDAQTLVHYGLPNKSKTNFYLRYFTLKNFQWDQRSFWKTEDKCETDNLLNIILIDDENHYQLPHIVDFVLRLGGNVSTQILHKCQEIRRQIEVEKWNSPICENLLAFGRCRNLRSCPQRHALVRLWDSRRYLPLCGWVHFVVLKTLDASCFSVRLVEHTDSEGKTSKLGNSHSEFSLKLSQYYKVESNRRAHGMPKVGDVCAVKSEGPEEGVFYRAKVIEYLKLDKHSKPLEVNVKLIDEGSLWKRKSIELYELPAELSQHPPTAIDVRILGVQPLDFDVSWSQVANDFTQKLMTAELEEHQYWSGKIVLALNGVLFLDPVKRNRFLPSLNAHVFDLVLRDELLNNGVAVANEQHLPSLLKMCSEGGVDVPETDEIKKENSGGVQPQWAFLDSTTDFIPVRFLAAENTSTVFLQNKNFEKLLVELEEDCQKEGSKTWSEIKARNGNCGGLSFAVGMFCLALFEDGKWNRGRIESEKGEEFHVYYVDHGDFLFVPKCDVVPISDSLLLRLPCQAIECSLVGIEEKEECPLEVLERIYSFSDDGKKKLYACVVSRDLKANVTGGRKYSVNLIDGAGVSVNKMLVDGGMVLPLESDKEHLKDVDVEMLKDEDEEIEEEEEDALREEEADEENSGLNVSEDYFNSLADHVFEDEGAQEFLKEFALKIFNVSGTQEITSKGTKETSENIKKTPTDEDSPKRGMNVEETVEELPKSTAGGEKKEVELKGRQQVLTPQVLWCQNQLEVQIKIMLGGVQDYALECTVRNFSFRCYVGNKFYSVDLRLYGAINPQMTKVTLKAFHVVTTLTKLTFPLWPRLHEDEGRSRWINLDVESLADRENLFSNKIRSAKLEIASGALKKGIRNETILPCSDSEDSNSCEGLSDSEEIED